MEAKLLNTSTVYVKWKAPAAKHHNGVLKSYNVIVRGVNVYENVSKVLTNITIDSSSSSIMLANLTEGVTYTVSVAAVNRIGLGPYSKEAILRLDPITKKLDTSFSYRFPLHNDHSDDFLTQPWFIILLGTILVIMMLSFGIMVYIKRKHILMKQSAFNGLAGKHSHKLPRKSFELINVISVPSSFTLNKYERKVFLAIRSRAFSIHTRVSFPMLFISVQILIFLIHLRSFRHQFQLCVCVGG